PGYNSSSLPHVQRVSRRAGFTQGKSEFAAKHRASQMITHGSGRISMEYRSIGADLPAPACIVLGTMIFGLDRADDWFALLDAYKEMGGNCLDTGRIYRGGESEQVIGAWLKHRG